MFQHLKAAIRSTLHRAGYDLVPWHAHLPYLWSNDADFLRFYGQMRQLTLVPPERCFTLYQMAMTTRVRPGVMAEVGVYRGGTAKLLGNACPDKELHLFDTFTGMPATDPRWDRHRAGEFADTSLEVVRETLSDISNVRFHPGFFPETAGPVENLRFSLVNVDVDIYSSASACLEFFYPRMVPGGIMVFDDYDSPKCPGIGQAIAEFLADKSERQIVTARYQCVLIKH